MREGVVCSKRLDRGFAHGCAASPDQGRVLVRGLVILNRKVVLITHTNKTDSLKGRSGVVLRFMPDEVGRLFTVMEVALQPWKVYLRCVNNDCTHRRSHL
jgi:hypothetical protein